MNKELVKKAFQLGYEYATKQAAVEYPEELLVPPRKPKRNLLRNLAILGGLGLLGGGGYVLHKDLQNLAKAQLVAGSLGPNGRTVAPNTANNVIESIMSGHPVK